jgi:predicted metal-dependent HD superfamily phosphohydrolase
MTKILEKVEQYVTELLTEQLDKNIFFHNLKHTRQVLKAANEISAQMNVSNKEKELMEIAIWFHDTGFIKDYINHEEESVKIAETFLEKQNYPKENIEVIKEAILKTSLDTLPETKIEKIIRDADLAHVAKKAGLKRGQFLRKELHFFCNKQYSDSEWYEIDKNFYSNVNYFTDYAQKNWQPKIEKNISRIEKKLMAIDDKDEKSAKKNTAKDGILSEKDKKKLHKIKTTERGVETVFRVTSRNHLTLSSMADSKANTLISISALVISILLSFLVDNMDVQSQLILPTSILLVVCVLTIIFATLSTRPKVTKLGLSKEDIEKRRGNLLFFGNFYRMPLDDFEWGMKELMEDRDYLYSNLTKDIYFLGLVLARKYKFLSIAYNVFMYGIIISVLCFIIAMYHG